MEKNIHQIWIGPYKMPKRETFCVEKVKRLQMDYEHMFWTDDNLPELPSEIKIIYDFLGKGTHYAHQADVLRIFLIQKYGGVYLDVDFEFKQGISQFELENYEAFFCTHFGGVDTFPNGVFGMKKNHPLCQYFLDDMIEGFPIRYWYGPSWFANVIKSYFGVSSQISHDEFSKKYFRQNNIFYINYDQFHNNNYFHHALYSWSPVVREQFKMGEIL